MKTAVEWLVDKLLKGEFINDTESLIEQAKEMEKQQIMKAYRDGRNDESSSKARHNYNRNSIQYFNEEFNS
jgi:hypothetical protein